MRSALSLLLAGAAVCLGQSALTPPQAAFVLDGTGSLRPLNGMSQSFVLGSPVRDNIVAFACTWTTCLLKTQSSLSGDVGDVPAPTGDALISMRGDGTALVYFASTGQFAWHRNGTLEMLDWQVDGAVLAVRAQDDGARIAVRRSDGVWIVRQDSAIEGSLPDGVTAVLFVGGQVLYSTATGLTLEREDRSTLSFDLAGVVSLRLLNDRYAQVSTTDAEYVLRLDTGREELSMLPAALEAAQ